jgi:hypothetical protein
MCYDILMVLPFHARGAWIKILYMYIIISDISFETNAWDRHATIIKLHRITALPLSNNPPPNLRGVPITTGIARYADGRKPLCRWTAALGIASEKIRLSRATCAVGVDPALGAGHAVLSVNFTFFELFLISNMDNFNCNSTINLRLNYPS